jgi:hypothetical protein
VIEPNDYEMTRHIADLLMEGATENDLEAIGYLTTDESRLCYSAAKERPVYWSNMALSTEAAGCMSALPDEWLERNLWYIENEEIFEKAYGGGNRSDAGRYAAQVRWQNHQKKNNPPKESKRLGPRFDPKNRKKGVKVSSPKDALNEIARGNLVELDSVGEAYTVLEKLGKFIKDAKKDGSKAKINVCKISVPGTNLFCGASIATDKYPDGVPRIEMPQLSGIPIKGSRADKMPRIDDEGNVDIGKLFSEEYLANLDPPVRVVDAEVPAASLRASQSELKGKTVAYFMSKEGREKLDDPNSVIYVSRDGYIIDGHHRWAGKVGVDLEDGKTGDVKIKIRRIDMPIMEVLDAALDFAENEIQPKNA